MYPHERSLVNELKDKPFALIGVNSDDDLQKIREIVKEKEINWRSFQNKPSEEAASISMAWAVRGWPTLVVLDADFKIRYRGHNGDQAIELVRSLVEKLETHDTEEAAPAEPDQEEKKTSDDVFSLEPAAL